MNESVYNKIKFMNDYKGAKNAAEGSKYDANANVTSRNIATMSAELGKKDCIDLQREVMKEYLTKMYRRKHCSSISTRFKPSYYL